MPSVMMDKNPFFCDECQEHVQITDTEFDKMEYEGQRELDCKTLIKGGQCGCYSHSHGDKS